MKVAFRLDEQDLQDELLRRLLGPIGSELAFEFKAFRTEIQQETGFHAGGHEVIYQLHLASRTESLVRFQFHHDPALHQHVRGECAHDHTIVLNCNRFFALDLQPLLAQLVG